MNRLLAVLLLAALGGCAVAPSGSPNYGSRMAQEPFDPYQWHVVSSEPVQSSRTMYASRLEVASFPDYSSQPVYVRQPVYVQRPVYLPQPYYYNPPVTIGLDFMFGAAWFGGRHGGRGHHRGGHR